MPIDINLSEGTMLHTHELHPVDKDRLANIYVICNIFTLIIRQYICFCRLTTFNQYQYSKLFKYSKII